MCIGSVVSEIQISSSKRSTTLEHVLEQAERVHPFWLRRVLEVSARFDYTRGEFLAYETAPTFIWFLEPSKFP